MIEETRKLQQDPYYRVLSLFTSIYGIGPVKAKELYTMGMRNLKDLEVYYTGQLKNAKNKANVEGMLHSLALHDDFSVKYVK